MHYEIAEPECVYENISGEVLVLNLSTGIYTQLRGLSALVFETFASGVSVDDLREAMQTAGYGRADVATVEARIVDWCGQGYLRRSMGEPNRGSIEIAPGNGFDEQRWADLSELIKVDPVHNVTPQGWPQSSK